MSGDLISRSALMEDMRNTITESSDTMDWLNLINRQPVAYDVDKVVEQLKNTGQKMSEAKLPHRYYKAIGTRKAVEIVKAGGVK